MSKEKRVEKIKKMLFVSLKNLFHNQTDLNFDEFSVCIIESLMLLEREVYLKSEAGKNDSGNGAYVRKFSCLRRNSLQISIPRSRNGKFKPMTMELLHRQKEQVNELALLLYRKGMSSRDISAILDEYFGESMSRETINNLAESFHEIRKAWEDTTLDSTYKVVYCDALFTNLKRGNNYSKEAVHIMYGLKENNTRELLLLEVNPTEGSNNWGNYFNKIKQRGVKDIDLVVADGLKYLENQVNENFPNANFQKCVVHLQRGMLLKVRPKDKHEFSKDFKEFFDNFDTTSTKEKAYDKLLTFVAKWKNSYPKMVARLVEEGYIDHYFTYIGYCTDVRRMIYTTNTIENLNRQIRKVLKTKVSFNKEKNLLDLVFMIIRDIQMTTWKYPINQFKLFERIHP